MRRPIALVLSLAWLAPGAVFPAEAPAPPVAKKNAHESVLHGETRVDPYYWLREKDNPEVVAYLEAENRYTETVMQPTAALQETLYREMLGRIQQTDLTVPQLDDGFYYYRRTEEGKQYPIFCRRKGSLEAPEEVMLDGNALAQGEKFLGFGGQAVSPDGNLLAYATDVSGFRQFTLYVKDLRTGRLLADRREKVAGFAWADDNKTLFYAVEDHAKRPYRIYRHRLGEAEDTLVFEEKDERFRVGVRRSRSDAYLLLAANSLTTSEIRYLPAGQPEGEWKLVAPRRHDVDYGLDHRGGSFYLWVNDTGRNYRVVEAPVSDPSPANWKEILPHRPEVMLEGISVFKDHLVLYELEAGLQHVAVKSFATGETHRIAFPEPVYSVFGRQNPEFDTSVLRFVYQSFVTPPSVYDYDVTTRERTLLKQTEVLGGYDAGRYASERIFVPAADGARVPVSIMYRKDVARDGRAPLYLTGYGAYGAAIPVVFNPNVLSLLDRGVVYAVAHVRGGGEMGKAWHDQGRMLQKKNTFTDFVAAAEALVAGKYAARDKVVIQGGSAGGLLMGAVTNLRPDLWKAVIADVPFVDIVNTMSDPKLPLTVAEFEEWGNPNSRAEYDYIKTYCPYTNVAARDYPALLVTTSLNDSQVMYWEPAKWVAKLRAHKTDGHPLLLRTNMAGGHGGSSGRYDRLREVAFAYAFALWQVGLADSPATAAGT